MIKWVQEAWSDGKLASMLLIDIKEEFDHISSNILLRTMKSKGADGDLMRWTVSFMSDRSVSLGIDSHQCTAAGIETGVPQGLLVSPILFAIYQGDVFRELKKEVKGWMTMSFSENYR